MTQTVYRPHGILRQFNRGGSHDRYIRRLQISPRRRSVARHGCEALPSVNLKENQFQARQLLEDIQNLNIAHKVSPKALLPIRFRLGHPALVAKPDTASN